MDTTVTLFYLEYITAVCLYLRIDGDYDRVLENTLLVVEFILGKTSCLVCLQHKLWICIIYVIICVIVEWSVGHVVDPGNSCHDALF